eukprot:COSAG01_NODE_32533_length_579_cov_1.620833_1_plen_47_part_10
MRLSGELGLPGWVLGRAANGWACRISLACARTTPQQPQLAVSKTLGD